MIDRSSLLVRAFLDELKRRGVLRAAALYAVVAWAIIESTATILPALGIPEWTVTTIIVIALAGFPFCLIGAWIFDFTRGGIVRTRSREQLDASELQRVGHGRLIDFVIITVLGVAVIWLGWERLQRDGVETTVAGEALDSIAVLPFANLSDDPANAYFGDGLAEELLNVLVGIDGLRVTARTSSFQYRGQNLDVREIGRSLGVATVLEGSVRKAGERVRVTAQLIRAADGFHLWSQTYNSELADIFAVQDQISAAIAEALRGHLLTGSGAPDEPTQSAARTRQTSNVEAFEAYLRGRFAMNQRTPESLQQAVTDFRRAIELDPQYAAAFSGLADSYILQSNYADLDRREALRLAEPMMQRAIDLDPGLAEAQATQGFVLTEKGDDESAVAAFKRAIELNPSYSPAYHWMALRFEALGRFDEARLALQDCLRVDPNYVTGKRVLLGLLRTQGEHAQADELAQSMLAEHADDALVHYAVGDDAMVRNRLVDAVRHLAEAARLQPGASLFRISLIKALVAAGDLSRAEAQFQIVQQLSPDNPMLDIWRLRRAQASGEIQSLAQWREQLDAMAPSEHRDRELCDLAVAIGDVQGTLDTCGASWAQAQWQSGDPLPKAISNSVAGLFAAYAAAGLSAEKPAERLEQATDEVLATLESGGMSPQMLAFFHAQVSMGKGDPEPLLALLPQWLPVNQVSANDLRNSLTWAPLREDPRFRALIEQTAAREAEVLEQVRAVPLPGA